MLKTLKDKPRKTILAAATVVEVAPSRVSTSGNNMVTEFKLRLDGPAAGEAQNGTRVWLTWSPHWFRSGFDICALETNVEKLAVLADQGDPEAAQQRAMDNSVLWTAKANIFGDESKETPTLRGLIGGRDWEEHNSLWGQFCNVVEQLGRDNPEQADAHLEESPLEVAAQDAIIKGVDAFFKEFFGETSLAGKFVVVTYGHKKEAVKDEDGNPVYDAENKRVYAPAKYRNVLRFVIPGVKTDMTGRLASWRKSCAKPDSQTAYMIDDSEPFVAVPF